MQHPAIAHILPGLPRQLLLDTILLKARRAATCMLSQTWRIVAGLTVAAVTGATVLIGGVSGTAMVLGEEDAAAAGVCLGSCGTQ